MRDRLLREMEFENKHPASKRRRQSAEFLVTRKKDAEALRGIVHELPGAGTNAVIQWIIRMFEEARGYTNGVEFVCVAFQNRVAPTMKGSTLHHAGDVAVGDTQKQRTQVAAHRR